jgi:hypothetical protein
MRGRCKFVFGINRVLSVMCEYGIVTKQNSSCLVEGVRVFYTCSAVNLTN